MLCYENVIIPSIEELVMEEASKKEGLTPEVVDALNKKLAARFGTGILIKIREQGAVEIDVHKAVMEEELIDELLSIFIKGVANLKHALTPEQAYEMAICFMTAMAKKLGKCYILREKNASYMLACLQILCQKQVCNTLERDDIESIAEALHANYMKKMFTITKDYLVQNVDLSDKKAAAAFFDRSETKEYLMEVGRKTTMVYLQKLITEVGKQLDDPMQMDKYTPLILDVFHQVFGVKIDKGDITVSKEKVRTSEHERGVEGDMVRTMIIQD